MFAIESHSVCVNINYLFTAEILHKGASITSSRLVDTRPERHIPACIEKTQANIVKSVTFTVFLKDTLKKKDSISHQSQDPKRQRIH